MLTAKQKCITDQTKIISKESKYSPRANNLTIKEDFKRGRI
jgi:hypothetical protein